VWNKDKKLRLTIDDLRFFNGKNLAYFAKTFAFFAVKIYRKVRKENANSAKEHIRLRVKPAMTERAAGTI